MQSEADWVREAIAAALRAERDEIHARAIERDVDEASRIAARARAALGTGEGRERLEQAISTRALDASSYGAVLEHLARIAECEVLARRGAAFRSSSADRVVIDDRERTLLELASDARDAVIARARPALSALADHVARDRAARLESFADATDRRARIRARGPAMPDDAPAELAKQCIAFLAATDDAAGDLVERAHHAVGDRITLVTRIAALAPPALDAIVPARGRARRVGSIFEGLGLTTELRQQIALSTTAAFTIDPYVVALGASATIYTPTLELGVTSERGFIAAIAEALTRVLVSRALPIEHARPPRASVAVAMGALFATILTEPKWIQRSIDASAAAQRRLSVASTATIVLEARLACATALSGAPSDRTEDAARELAARALVIDPSLVTPELARSSWVSPTQAETRTRSLLAALAWAPALRERYDEDFFRNPRLADFVRGAAARGGTVSAEDISDELGATPAHAAARVIELAERAGG